MKMAVIVMCGSTKQMTLHTLADKTARCLNLQRYPICSWHSERGLLSQGT